MSLVGVVVPGVTHPGGQTSTRITAASPSGVAEASGCLRTSPTLGAAHTGFGGTTAPAYAPDVPDSDDRGRVCGRWATPGAPGAAASSVARPRTSVGPRLTWARPHRDEGVDLIRFLLRDALGWPSVTTALPARHVTTVMVSWEDFSGGRW